VSSEGSDRDRVEVLEGVSSSTKAELSCRYRQAHDDPTLGERRHRWSEDLTAATTFFVELGLKVLGEGPVEGGSCLRSRLADGSGC
jgi:hypothetical protein